MIGPFDHGGESPDDVPGFRHDGGDEDEAPLIVRLKRAHLRAHAKLKRAPADEGMALRLQIRKLEMFVGQVEKIEDALDVMTREF